MNYFSKHIICAKTMDSGAGGISGFLYMPIAVFSSGPIMFM
jgi:hypothetical protein